MVGWKVMGSRSVCTEFEFRQLLTSSSSSFISPNPDSPTPSNTTSRIPQNGRPHEWIQSLARSPINLHLSTSTRRAIKTVSESVAHPRRKRFQRFGLSVHWGSPFTVLNLGLYIDILRDEVMKWDIFLRFVLFRLLGCWDGRKCILSSNLGRQGTRWCKQWRKASFPSINLIEQK